MYVVQSKSSGFNFVRVARSKKQRKAPERQAREHLLFCILLPTLQPTTTIVIVILHYLLIHIFKMKLALIASLIGAASAFAPASTNGGMLSEIYLSSIRGGKQFGCYYSLDVLELAQWKHNGSR